MKFRSLLLIGLWSCSHLAAAEKKPDLIIIFVIDQFPFYIIEKIRPHLQFGLKMLLDRGIQYVQCYHPHAVPSTATGHAALSTGCFAKDHGIIGNSWFDMQGNKIAADDDTAQESGVFGADGSIQSYGKSHKQLLVDTISDSFVNQSDANQRNRTYAISLKSRAAIMSAGTLGKPFWFDEKSGNMTTSKKYFKHLPDWIIRFNNMQAIKDKHQFYWKRFFSLYTPYQHTNIKNHKHARESTYLEKLLVVNHRNKKPFEDFMHTPMANKLVLDCAYACIQEKYKRTSADAGLMLWINISSTDKIGHVFGPESLEYTDMLYHLDAQIGEFIKRVRKQIPASRIVWALTSDHGVEPIPEHSQKKGFKAHRVFYKDILKELNDVIAQKFDISNLIYNFQEPQFYLNQDLFGKQEETTQNDIIQTLQQKIMKYPGVKRVWTTPELERTWYDMRHLESYYKYQLYPGRSGQLTLQLQPFNQFTTYAGGTAHRSPYNYNTHIPLVIYQKNQYEKQIITDRTYSLQLAPTLAHIVNIPRPSAATFDILPGIAKQP